MKEKKPLRKLMPETAEFIDAARAAFGAADVDAALRAGVSGQPAFWAGEAGNEVGTRSPVPALSVSGSALFVHVQRKGGAK
ncbi:hypothetical protein [Rhodocyclus purpureus]|uniref:hypothetical protein n=1 Tax=Rhodocyclus purpureus TaxID=1067 RepID=UPI0019118F51|nr:hypothetical protein [Rhodocyclus purpureus]MBK5915136.1 hypothetical protein [Rhodocyclus purpureus]